MAKRDVHIEDLKEDAGWGIILLAIAFVLAEEFIRWYENTHDLSASLFEHAGLIGGVFAVLTTFYFLYKLK